MNKLTKIIIKSLLVLGVFFIIGYAGTLDYRQEVIHSMSQELYKQVLIDLGGTAASDKEICDKYISDKSKYDSLKI